ncbi:MAG: hypothetical protein E7402_03305 [Ruminococcaceae bacterium]|nr:hypothetical protein [Oscillospiraceae bacterium]
MKRTLRKLSTIVLVLTFVMSLLPVATFAAEEETQTLFNNYSETRFDFDDPALNDPALQGQKAVETAYFRTDNMTPSGATCSFASVTEDGVSALKFTKSGSGKANSMINFGLNADAGSATGRYKKKLDVAFSTKLTADPGGRWGYYLRSYGISEGRVLGLDGQYITFFENPVFPLTYNQWIDIEFSVDVDLRCGIIKVRNSAIGSETGEPGPWQSFAGCFDKLFSSATGATAYEHFYQNGFLTIGGMTSTFDFFLTDYMQNLRTADEALTPSLETLSDDFASFPAANSTSAIYDSQTAWNTSNIGGTKATTASVSEGRLTLTTTQDSGTSYPGLIKTPFYAAPNLRHHMKFRMSAPAIGNISRFSVTLTSNQNGLADGSRTPEFIKIGSDGSGSYIQVASEKNYVAYDPYDMFDCEFVYDAKEQVAKISVLDAEGNQYIGDAASLATTGGASWDILRGILFQNQATATGTTYFYLEDFYWNLLSRESVATETTVASFEIDGEDTASLDETIMVDCGQTLDYAQAVETAEVTVLKNGTLPVDTAYTLAAEGSVLTVTFADLEPATNYTILVSGISTLAGDIEPDLAQTFFTTYEVGISATTPVLDGDAVTATIRSGYREGKQVLLITTLYNEEGALIDVKISDLTQASTREGELFTVELGDAEYSSAKAYIWSGFNDMNPYHDVTSFAS